jgi:lysophospholipase L1-like esterase
MELVLLPQRRWALALGVLVAACAGASTPVAGPGPASSDPPAAPPPATELADASLEAEPALDAAPEAAAEASAPEASAPEASTPLPLPEGTTVLHIGDSMAGALGVELNHELAKQKVTGVLRFKTASYIPSWAWSKQLPVYLAQYKPDLVLITLGTNEVKIPDPNERIPTIKKLVARLGGRPCVWIAPPVWTKEMGLYQVIRDNIAPCRYMDTAVVYPDMPRLDDKIHPTIPARRVWAKRVVDWLQKERRPTAERPWAMAREPGSGG